MPEPQLHQPQQPQQPQQHQLEPMQEVQQPDQHQMPTQPLGFQPPPFRAASAFAAGSTAWTQAAAAQMLASSPQAEVTPSDLLRLLHEVSVPVDTNPDSTPTSATAPADHQLLRHILNHRPLEPFDTLRSRGRNAADATRVTDLAAMGFGTSLSAASSATAATAVETDAAEWADACTDNLAFDTSSGSHPRLDSPPPAPPAPPPPLPSAASMASGRPLQPQRPPPRVPPTVVPGPRSRSDSDDSPVDPSPDTAAAAISLAPDADRRVVLHRRPRQQQDQEQHNPAAAAAAAYDLAALEAYRPDRRRTTGGPIDSTELVLIRYSSEGSSVIIYAMPSKQLHDVLGNFGVFRPGMYEPATSVDPEVLRIGSYKSQRYAASRYLPYPAEFVGDVLELYFERVYPYFPMIDKEQFYADWKASRLKPSLLLLVSAMCAVVMQQPGQPLMQKWQSVIGANPVKVEDEFFKHARAVLGDVFDFFDEFDVYMVQGLLHLVLLFCGTNWLFPPACLLGLAHRLAIEIGLHRDLSGVADAIGGERLVQTYQRTWYCLYLLDRYVGMTEGRPLIIKDGGFNTPLPPSGPENPLGELLVQHFLVIRVLGDVLDLLNGVPAPTDPRLQRPSARRRPTPRELAKDLLHELMALRAGLPIPPPLPASGSSTAAAAPGRPGSWGPAEHVWCAHVACEMVLTKMVGGPGDAAGRGRLVALARRAADLLERLPETGGSPLAAATALSGNNSTLPAPSTTVWDCAPVSCGPWVFAGIDWMAVAATGILLDVAFEARAAAAAAAAAGAPQAAVPEDGLRELPRLMAALGRLWRVSKFVQIAAPAFR
ncbi:hypothetical protein HK405_010462, partial [Cladochytrium tenue]